MCTKQIYYYPAHIIGGLHPGIHKLWQSLHAAEHFVGLAKFEKKYAIQNLYMELSITEINKRQNAEIDFRRYRIEDGTLHIHSFQKYPKRKEVKLEVPIVDKANKKIGNDLIKMLRYCQRIPRQKGGRKALVDPRMLVECVGEVNNTTFRFQFENYLSQLIEQLPFLAIEYFEQQLQDYSRQAELVTV